MVSFIREMNTMKTLESIHINLKQQKKSMADNVSCLSLFIHNSFLTLENKTKNYIYIFKIILSPMLFVVCPFPVNIRIINHKKI